MSNKKSRPIWKVQSSGEIFPVVLSRKEIELQLQKVTRKLTRRLIKLANFPDCKHVDKWTNEVYLLLHNISKFPNNELPYPIIILDNTYRYAENLIIFWDKTIIEDYTASLGPSAIQLDGPDAKEKELQSRIYEYFRHLAVTLSTYGEISRADCRYFVERYVQNIRSL